LTIRLLSNCRRVAEELARAGRVAVIHHWDADGLASAAVIARHLKSRSALFSVPRVGYYSLSAIDINAIKEFRPDLVLVLDYGLPASEVRELSRAVNSTVGVVDHHVNECADDILFCNPLACGSSEEEYPSTTWVLKNLINAGSPDDMVSLGIVGDLGKVLEDHPLKDWVDATARKYGLTLQDLVRASELVDTCYRLVDYECMEAVRNTLIEGGVAGILQSELLKSKLVALRSEVEEAIGKLELLRDYGILKVFKLRTRSYITSLVGRELAHRYWDSVVVLVHHVEKLGLEYIYVRNRKFSLRGVLERLKAEGLRVGGKDKVFVVTIRNEVSELDRLVSSLLQYLRLG